jgi:hypothetical protein
LRYSCLRIDIHQDRTEAIQEEIITKMDAHQERMEISINAWQKETIAWQEAMEACLVKAKANPEKMKAGLEEMEAAVDFFEERMYKMTPQIWRQILKKQCVSWSIKSLTERPHWKLSEHWRTDMGTGIYL